MALIGTRRKTIDRRLGGRRAIWVNRVQRFGIKLAVVVFIVWMGAWLHFSGSFSRAGYWVDEKILDITADMGFKVENILVEGREFTDAQALRAIINIDKGDPLFLFDPGAARKSIEELSWVKKARIERRLPDTIYIGIEERLPLALWQKDKQLHLIDADGQVVNTDGLKRFKDLIVVMGEGAPAQAKALLDNIAAEPVLQERTKVARWIDGRRWDLSFEKDITVKLPETDLGLALRRLALAQEEDGLLDKDITSVDLREPDRIVVRTRPGAVQEYKAGLKTGDNI